MGNGTSTVARGGRSTLRVDGRSVVLVLQSGPGARSGLGLAGLALRVAGVDGLLRTDDQGAATIPLGRGDRAVVELVDPDAPDTVWARWVLRGVRGVPAASTWAGVRARLNHLGYDAGRDGEEEPDLALEEAVLQFQADADPRRTGEDELQPTGITTRLHPRESSATQVVSATLDDYDRQAIVAAFERDQGEAGEVVALRDGGPGEGRGDASEDPPGWVLNVFRKQRLALVRWTRLAPPSERASETRTYTSGSGETRTETADMPVVHRHPWLDDRGRRANHAGPILGTTASDGREVRVRLARTNLFDTAPLYVVSRAPRVCGVSGSQPRAGGEVRLTTTAGALPADRWEATATIEVPLGARAGPRVGDLLVRVFRPIVLDVAVHDVRFGGENCVWWQVQQAFDRINRYFVQAGIVLRVRHFRPIGIDHHLNLHQHLDDVRRDERVAEAEYQRLQRQRHLPNAINLYVVPTLAYLEARGAVAIGARPTTPASFLSGCLVKAERLGQGFLSPEPTDVVHELGHVLGLTHVDPENTTYRTTAWALRRVMFRLSAPPAEHPPWRHEHAIGGMFTLRDIRGDPNDHEVDRMRTRAGRTSQALAEAGDRSGPYDWAHWEGGEQREWPPRQDDGWTLWPF